jgi:hypothetical protein
MAGLAARRLKTGKGKSGFISFKREGKIVNGAPRRRANALWRKQEEQAAIAVSARLAGFAFFVVIERGPDCDFVHAN